MRSPTVSRAFWHRRVGALVAGWLTAPLVVALVHPFVPGWHWLLVHLLVLGAASTAILI
jgi:nitrite reductase (NO-forming)